MKEIHLFVRGVLMGIESPIIFEIGAHKGEDTMMLCKVPNAVVHAFECDPRNLLYDMPSNVVVNYKAISDKEGMMDFWLDQKIGSKWVSSWSFFESNNDLVKQPQINFQHRVQVKCTTLEAYCNLKRIDRIDFLWMDTQGAEAMILEASKNAIKNTSWIYTEYSNREDFKGQKSLDEIMLILGEDWEIEKIWDWDVLLKNKRYV